MYVLKDGYGIHMQKSPIIIPNAEGLLADPFTQYLVDSARARVRPDLDEFKALQECLYCGDIDYHWIERIYLDDNNKPYLDRKCKKCGKEWVQR